MNEHDFIEPGVLADVLSRAVGKELPLKYDGFEIGTALILSEGHFVAKLNHTDVSEEVQTRIFGDHTKSISIGFRT